MEITRDTFRALPSDNKMDVIFDILTEIQAEQANLDVKIEKCNVQTAQRKKIDTTVAGTMGFVGGFVGFLSHLFFGGGK